MIQKAISWLTHALQNSGMGQEAAIDWAAAIACLCAMACACLVFALLKHVVEPIANKITEKTETKIDDILLRDAFLQWVWWFITAWLLTRWLHAILPTASLNAAKWVDTILNVILIGLATKAVVEFLKGIFLIVFDKEHVEEEAMKIRLAEDNDQEYQYIPSHSLKGLQQMLNLIIVFIGGVLMVSALIGKSPVLLISGLGAGAAVLMLVFKDSILGVVAGIQLTANDMLRPGDWIVAPSYGANGRVQEVTLATVKVLNWDHTIITIPPYNLITGSFQNWRKMEESGGRRVMRAFNIDMTTVRFATPEEAARAAAEPWGKGIDPNQKQVNLSLFRRYLEHYISNLPTLRPTMLYMVRELAPTPEGLPIEIYFFTSETSWARYEAVQAAALDHILAVVHDFGLRIFQSPTGADLRHIR